VSLWLATLRVAGRSPRTIEGYQETLARFERFLGREALTATRLDCMRFVTALQETLAPASVSHHYRGLRAFLGWAVREELIDNNPATNLRLSVPNTIKDTPTVEQVNAMLTAARQDRRALAILTILADTGCRRGELAAVTRAEVDLTSGVLRLPVSKTRARVVPISDRAVVAIGRWMRHRHCVPTLRAHPSLWSRCDPLTVPDTGQGGQQAACSEGDMQRWEDDPGSRRRRSATPCWRS
jgi:integrase/recombinase XerC